MSTQTEIKLTRKDIQDAFACLQHGHGFEITNQRRHYWMAIPQWNVDETIADGDAPTELIGLVNDQMPGIVARI